jgi:hypothetical protein
MVDVRQQTPKQLRDWADRLLSGLLSDWKELPEIAVEIDEWDDSEALDFIEEWRFVESQRYDLERIADTGVLTAEQDQRLDELRKLVSEHKPLLDRLLDPRAAS